MSRRPFLCHHPQGLDVGDPRSVDLSISLAELYRELGQQEVRSGTAYQALEWPVFLEGGLSISLAELYRQLRQQEVRLRRWLLCMAAGAQACL